MCDVVGFCSAGHILCVCMCVAWCSVVCMHVCVCVCVTINEPHPSEKMLHDCANSTHLIICDPLSENLALCANIEFELEAILSLQVISQLNSDYYTNVSQGPWTVSY